MESIFGGANKMLEKEKKILEKIKQKKKQEIEEIYKKDI